MSPNPPGSSQLPRAGTRVHGDLFADDEPIGDELADGLAGIGVGYFGSLVRIEPDLTFAAADHRGRQALLRAEVYPAVDSSAFAMR